jgi:hypothetical protein
VSDAVTIETARQVQADLGMSNVHVAYVSKDWFVIAHTTQERLEAGAGHADLRDCGIHQWLVHATTTYLDCGVCLPEPGWYQIAGVHDVKGIAL